MKKFQNAHIIILVLLFIGVSCSMVLAVQGIKEMFDAKKSMEIFPSSIPTLNQIKQAYTTADYNESLKLLDVNEAGVEIKVSETGLSIVSPSIEKEFEVRHVLLNLLALDKNLKISSICANPNNSCEGNALSFILTGERTISTVSNPEGL